MKKMISIILLWGLGSNAYAAEKITVYTTTHYPISHQHLADHIYYLDQVDRLENQFLASYPLGQHPEQALQQINQLKQTADWQQQEQKLKQAYEGVINGFMQGIRKVPAVHITDTANNKNYVVYGISDVTEALNRYRQYRERKGD